MTWIAKGVTPTFSLLVFAALLYVCSPKGDSGTKASHLDLVPVATLLLFFCMSLFKSNFHVGLYLLFGVVSQGKILGDNSL